MGWDDRPLVGNVEVAAERLRELPWQQLVVIGEPGAGKSVLALMLVDQLLSAPAKGDPVPVLVELSSWNPREETVERFVARRLVEDFGVSRRVADRLLSQPRIVDGVGARWWVMPVLDGLDEVHADLRADALLEVDRFAASDRPVVVTCRIREFQRTEGKARALSRAAVVRLEPLEPEDVVQFLSHSGTHADRWEPVFETLRSQPTGELARVLSTPLMAGMAKDVYSKADPGELVAQATREQLTNRLIDGYVASVYEKEVNGVRYRSKDAVRWLRSLAYLAYRDGTRDLRWWRLPWEDLTRRPRLVVWMRVVVPAVVAAVSVGAFLTLWFDWWRAAQVGVAAGALTAACVSGRFNRGFEHELQPASPGRQGSWLSLAELAVHRNATAIAHRGLFGAMCGAVAGLALGQLALALAAGLLCGRISGLARVVRWRPAWASRSGPAGTLRLNHLYAAMLAAVYSVTAAAVFAITAKLLGKSVPAWALAGAVSFGAGAWLAGGAGTWLRFRLTQLGAALSCRSGESLLPVRVMKLLDDGTHPERGTMRVNGSAWQFRHAIIQDRLLSHARPLILRRRADKGDQDAAQELAQLLCEQGDLDQLRHRADTGDIFAAATLAELLCEQGNIDEAAAVLRPHADSGDVALALASLLQEQGSPDEAATVLRPHADKGDDEAALKLAHLLYEQGNHDELRHRSGTGDSIAAVVLSGLLREEGSPDEAAAVLRPHADKGHLFATMELTKLLREQGNPEEAAAMLCRRADRGDKIAAVLLGVLLRDLGKIDEAAAALRYPADRGNSIAAVVLAKLLREHGNLDELRQRADRRDAHAARELAKLLSEHGNLDELRQRADTGNRHAARELARLLSEQGKVDEAAAVLRPYADKGYEDATKQLTHLLREQESLDEAAAVLRRQADIGDEDAARELAHLLYEQGDSDELRRRSATGEKDAAFQLARLLSDRGNHDEAAAVLRPHANAGDRGATLLLALLLRAEGDPAEATAVLRLHANAGDRGAALLLDSLLRAEGDPAEAAAALLPHANAAYQEAPRKFANLLSEQDRPDELRRSADTVDSIGVELLQIQNKLNEIRRELTDISHEDAVDQADQRERGDVNER